jgi:thioredoxin-dependent peroxiredoxin
MLGARPSRREGLPQHAIKNERFYVATITRQGIEMHTNGELPPEGSRAPAFTLVDRQLRDVHLSDYRGRKKLLSILPSLDTPTCALSTRKFNEYAQEHPEALVLVISADLPFAQGRFCTGEGLSNVLTLSTMRSDFARDYGVLIVDGPRAGLAARAVLVLDEEDTVLYSELVPELTQEPDYARALAVLHADPVAPS